MFLLKLSSNQLGVLSTCCPSLFLSADHSIMAPKRSNSGATVAADATDSPPVAVPTDGRASVASHESPPAGAAANPEDAIGSAIAVMPPSPMPDAEEDDVPEGPRNVRPRVSQALALPIPFARVSTIWQVSTGNGWWMDCSAPFASALETQFQQQVPVAQFAFFGNTRLGRIDYTHDLLQCQQFNHHTNVKKQIRRSCVTLGI